jgi:FAD synthase
MFSGIVIKGDGVARKLGYPTANLSIGPKDTKLKDGIYAAFAVIAKKKYEAALVVHSSANKVEVHLFDYTGKDIYGSRLSVDAVQKVSEIERMPEGELKKKIDNDIRLIREFFKNGEEV